MPGLNRGNGPSLLFGTVEQGAILWAAQWRTLGNTQAIRFDTGAGGARFTFGGSGCNVVTAASTGISGWPTENVLRVPSAANDIAGGNVKIGKRNLPAIEIGATRYFRIYMASTIDNGTTDDSAHPIESTTGPEEWAIIMWWERESLLYPNWVWGMFTDSVGHCIEATGNGFPIPFVERLQYHVYRFEWAIHRLDSTQFTLLARLFDGDETAPLATEEDLFYGSGLPLSGRTHTMQNATGWEMFDVGSNQGGWMPEGSSPQCYQAAPAISDTGWLGPYNPDTEPTWDE